MKERHGPFLSLSLSLCYATGLGVKSHPVTLGSSLSRNPASFFAAGGSGVGVGLKKRDGKKDRGEQTLLLHSSFATGAAAKISNSPILSLFIVVCRKWHRC